MPLKQSVHFYLTTSAPGWLDTQTLINVSFHFSKSQIIVQLSLFCYIIVWISESSDNLKVTDGNQIDRKLNMTKFLKDSKWQKNHQETFLG